MGIVTDLLSAGYSLFTGERQHQEQQEINRINLGIAQDQNQLAKEQFYDGVSVRAKDLENAGLSKTLAAGSSSVAGTMSSSNMTSAQANKLEKMELLNARKQNELLQSQIDSANWDNKSKEHNFKLAEQLNTVVGSQPSDISQLLRSIYDKQKENVDGVTQNFSEIMSDVSSDVQDFATFVSGSVTDISKLSGSKVQLSKDPNYNDNTIIQIGKFKKSVPTKVVTRSAGLFKLAGLSFEDGFIKLVQHYANKKK